jgi:hypothetical protein
MNFIVRSVTKLGILKHDLDYHLLRASMVIIFLFFGYQKWFECEAQALPPLSATARFFSACTRSLAFGGNLLSGSRGVAVRRTLDSQSSGTKNWEFSGLSAHLSPSSQPRQSFRSYPTAGPLPPADSRP